MTKLKFYTLKTAFKEDACPSGECRNTEGSYYCEEECSGLVQDIDLTGTLINFLTTQYILYYWQLKGYQNSFS